MKDDRDRPHAAIWVLVAVLSLAFLASGATKLAGMDQRVEEFQSWGYPAGFVYVVGALEVTAALGLWLRRPTLGQLSTRTLAAAGLTLLMVAATATHLIHGDAVLAVLPVVLGSLTGVSVWLWRDEGAADHADSAMRKP